MNGYITGRFILIEQEDILEEIYEEGHQKMFLFFMEYN